MLGNEQSAEFIRDWSVLMSKHCREREQTPDGWVRLGSGCYRVAYLNAIEGIVYKVEHRYGSGGQTNEGEFQNLCRMMLTRLPQGIRFPRYHLYSLDGRTVAAMEYLPKLLKSFSHYGEGQTYWSLQHKLCDTFPHLWDMHGGNIAVDERTSEIVPIDLGA